MAVRPVHTYSIVALDEETGQLGVAVQSHWFSVGSIVSWAEAGAGAVATQSFAELTYGPLGLELMRAGKSAEEALRGLLAADPQADRRQVAMVDARGNVAAHTGERCVQEAGHRLGKGYSVQANLMHRDTVWGAMAEAFERATGDLAERLVVALEAAEAEGGDIRGKQSAALLVVGGERTGNAWAGRLFDLRVEDHPEPLPELRRLLSVARAYRQADEAERELSEAGGDESRFQLASEKYRRAVELMPGIEANQEIVFWQAVALASAARVEEALPLFRQAFERDPRWRELVPRLVKAELLPDAPEMIERITELHNPTSTGSA